MNKAIIMWHLTADVETKPDQQSLQDNMQKKVTLFLLKVKSTLIHGKMKTHERQDIQQKLLFQFSTF